MQVEVTLEIWGNGVRTGNAMGLESNIYYIPNTERILMQVTVSIDWLRK
jgi:hypothetical protein